MSIEGGKKMSNQKQNIDPHQVLNALKGSLSESGPTPEQEALLNEVERVGTKKDLNMVGVVTETFSKKSESKKISKIPKWIKGNPYADKRIPDND